MYGLPRNRPLRSFPLHAKSIPLVMSMPNRGQPAEREAMKPFVIVRKNWLFANTRKGLDVSCAMYSLAETAIYNGLDVWAYMKWLISELPH